MSNRFRGKKNDKTHVDFVNKIKSCLFQEEASKYKFSNKELNNIVEVTGIDIATLNSHISNFLSNKMVHSFLKKRYNNGLLMPKNQDDLNNMLSNHDGEEFVYYVNKMNEDIFKNLGMTQKEYSEKLNERRMKSVLKKKRTWEF